MSADDPKASDADLAEAHAHATANYSRGLAAVPKYLLEAEKGATARLMRHKGNPFTKLQHLYELTDEISSRIGIASPCRRGCSGCCHYNVKIYAFEADFIRQNVKVREPLSKPMPRDFHGSPCPFLKAGQCSIYKFRPYVCRAAIAFTRTAYWCTPERANTGHLPMVRLSGLEEALGFVAAQAGGADRRDIREFFGMAQL